MTIITQNHRKPLLVTAGAQRISEQRASKKAAFTLFEVMVTITIIGLIAMIVAPTLKSPSRLRVTAAAELIASDIELAQVMTISFPEDPIVVRFDPASESYWLAPASAPDTPISRPGSAEPYAEVFGVGRAASALDVDLAVQGLPDNTLEFNSSGGLTNFAINPIITVSLDGHEIEITVAPTTGTLSLTSP